MYEWQAKHITSIYDGPPSLRPDQEALIALVYGTEWLRGKKDDQVYRIAENTYYRALRMCDEAERQAAIPSATDGEQLVLFDITEKDQESRIPDCFCRCMGGKGA